jgi:type IV pilus assembly protein PilV
MRPITDHAPRRQGGLTLIEVLVTVVILLIGLLGMAILLASSQKTESESYQRAQALLLLQDMATRINANRAVANCYAITDAGAGAPFLGTDSALMIPGPPPACGVGTVAAYTLANQDLLDWHELLLGATETLGGEDVGTLTGARGCVTEDASDPDNPVYTISIAWQGLSETADPVDPCGEGEYGDERLRRVVSMVVQIANLN